MLFEDAADAFRGSIGVVARVHGEELLGDGDRSTLGARDLDRVGVGEG